ncbi:uncharacterized protein JCM6883_002906 [Sporobolomyces salmoneus]|uniref:uncharacterized protein n=1 Tax=Sporobolomyces salmoneus TaxID=183962 RepID=UPI00317A0326
MLSRLRPQHLRLPFLLSIWFPLFATSIDARTISFSPRHTDILYSPQVNVWENGGGNDSMRTAGRAAKVEIKFAGEQITLFGSTSSSDILVNLDGERLNASTVLTLSQSASPSKLLQVSNLEANEDHTLEVEISGNGTFVLSRIAIAFSSANDHIPALLPVTTSSTASLSTSSSAPSPLQSSSTSSSSTFDDNNDSKSAVSPGKAVGGTVGALIAFSLLVLLFIVLYRRHRRRQSLNSSSISKTQRQNGPYTNQETGTRRGSFLLSAFQSPSRRASSFSLPWSSAPRTPVAPPPMPHPFNNALHINGGIGSSPRSPNAPGPGSVASPPVIVGSETWQTRLARAASWRRKTERLAETRKFYGVGGTRGGVNELRGPPPAVPLPRPPEAVKRGDGVREMEERWRVAKPSDNDERGLKLDRPSPPISISPYLVATPPQEEEDSKRKEGGNENRFEQACGQAISTNDDEDDDYTSIQVASPTSTIHPHRRSNAPRPTSKPLPLSPNVKTEFSSSSKGDLPYQNPFTLTRTLTTTTSHSIDESVPRSSIENARISQAQTRSIRPPGNSLGNSLPINLPLRSTSMRSVHEGTTKASPNGDLNVAEREDMVERKPSLTRIVNGKVLEDGTGRHPRGRHQSVAGVIEGRSSSESARRRMQFKRREEPELPGEEDRPDYFLKRVVVPKYSQDSDPRVVAGKSKK